MKRKLFFLLSLICLACASSYAGLYINEVNSTGKWIEIYNSGENTVNVGGYMITRNNNDNAVSSARIPTGTTIAAKGFLVLFQGPASEGTAPSPVAGAVDCLPFGISADKFMNAVLKDNQGYVVDDSFDVGNPQNVTVSGGKSWARETDGNANITALDPTPGKSNTSSPTFSELKIYINEVNSTGKWIEIYNDEPNTVNVGKYTVTRYNNDGAVAIAIIPTGTTIASKGFLVLYQGPASEGTAPSPVAGAVDCLTYGISSDKFMRAVLKDEQGNITDNTFDIGNPQKTTVSGGKSWAREADGNANIAALDPTPGKPNTSSPTFSDLKIYINEVNSTGNWIEIYNDEPNTIDVGKFTVTRYNNDGAVAIAIIPTGTTIASKGFLVLYQGSIVPAPVEGAIDCLPYGISSDKFTRAVLKEESGNITDNTFDIGNPQKITVSDGKSWGREPDGSLTIKAQNPTPGLKNEASSNSISVIFTAENLPVFVSAGILNFPEETSYFQLYTVAGKLIMNRNITETSIDLTNLPKGFYMARLMISGKLYTQRIVL